MKTSSLLRVAVIAAFAAALAVAAPMSMGNADVKSAGPLAFGPNGVLFIGDSVGAKIVAIDTGDTAAGKSATVNVQGIDGKIAAALGTTADQISIRDLVTNPVSRNVYISVSRGKGNDAAAVLLKLDTAGKMSEVKLNSVKFSSESLPNPTTSTKGSDKLDTITEIRYVDGKVLVAGLSNEEFSSNMKSIPYPFANADKGASIEMYHGSHGRFETNSPIRTFVPYTIGKQQYILAAYTCTPLVKIPVSDIKGGAKITGTTIAELGAGNRPLDMVAYKKDGKDYILMANSAHGVQKLDAAHLETYKPITGPTDVTGVPFQTINDLKGVRHLQAYDDKMALVLSDNNGGLDLKTVALP
jgi:hypothetical protein